MNNKIFLSCILFFFIAVASAETNVSDCTTLALPGQYVLNQSVSGSGTCFTINSSDVWLDCKGNSISYGSDGVNGRIGINMILGTVFLNNVSIKNCVIQDTNAAGTTGYGIFGSRVADSFFVNNSVQTNGTATNHGIYFTTGCDGNLFENNTINALGSTTGNYGVYLLSQSNNNVLRNNVIVGTGTTTSYAVYISGSDNNAVIGNNLSTISKLSTGNTDGHTVYLYAGSKHNVFRENYIYGESKARNYVVYLNLNNNYNTFANNTVYANGAEGTNYGIYILGSDFNEFTGNNILTFGTTANYGVYLGTSSSGNLIKNNSIITNGTTTNNYGVYLLSALYNNVTENFISANGGSTGNMGISLSSSQRNEFSRNTIFTQGTTTGYGVYLTGSDYDRILGNTISTFGTGTGNSGVYLLSSTNNDIVGNSILANGTSSLNVGVYLYTSSGYNYVAYNNISTGGTTTNYGVGLQTANNNTILGNGISTSGSSTTNHGVYLTTSANQNKILYNSISAFGTTTDHGISLTTSSDSNQIIGNNITANGSTTAAATTTSNYGISITTNCYNNNIENNTMLTDGGRYNYGFSLLVNSNYNSFKGNSIFAGGSGARNAGIYLSECRNTLLENNFVSASGSGTDYGIWLSSNSRHNSIKSNNISTFGGGSSYGVYMDAASPNYPHNNTFQSNVFQSIDGTELRIGTAEINQIWLVDQPINSYVFTGTGSLVIVRNSSAGEIEFLDRFTGSGSSLDVILRDNYVYVNDGVSGLNKPAEITLYNISPTSTELRILKDGVLCDPSICANLTSLQAGNVQFNVTGWSSYSIGAVSGAPSVQLNLPVDGVVLNSQEIHFNFTTVDDSSGNLNCSFYLDGSVSQTNSSTLNDTLTDFFIEGVNEGAHLWHVGCFDSAGNWNYSETRNFNVSVATPSQSFVSPSDAAYLNGDDFVLLSYRALDSDLRTMSVWLYGDGVLLNESNNVGNGTLLYYNWTGLSFGQHNWSIKTGNSLKNSTLETQAFNLINLSLSCEVGGPYQSGGLVLVYGSVSDGVSALANLPINVSFSSSEVTSSVLNSSLAGSFQTSFAGVGDGNYSVNVSTTYQGFSQSCLDSFAVGASSSLVIDKIVNFYNLTNESIFYNVSLRVVNKGAGTAVFANASDSDFGTVYLLGNLSGGEVVLRSYLINFTRGITSSSSELSLASAEASDSFSGARVSANSSQLNVTVPSAELGQQVVLVKNAYFNSENSTAVNYTLSLEVVNSGGIDLSSVTILDSDLGLNILVDLNRTGNYNYSNSIIVSKAASNTEKLFVKSTATVNAVTYESNQINVQIPGYGGPADTYVYAPASVSASSSFDSVIEILNQNLDVGQNFVLDYWITDDAETTNYSSGQRTVYVGASSSLNTTVSLTAPSSEGTYRLRAVVSYIGGPDVAYDSFVVSGASSSGTENSGGGSSGGGSNSLGGGPKVVGKVVNEVVCNVPYIRYGATCCLDENGNSICDVDEVHSSPDIPHDAGPITSEDSGFSFNMHRVYEGVTGLLSFVGNSLMQKKDYFIIGIFSAFLFVAVVLLIRWIIRRRPCEIRGLKHTRGLKVYAENGNYIGRVKEVYLDEMGCKVYGWLVAVDKKVYRRIKRRNVLIRQRNVRSIKEVVIVEARVSEHLEKFASSQ